MKGKKNKFSLIFEFFPFYKFAGALNLSQNSPGTNKRQKFSSHSKFSTQTSKKSYKINLKPSPKRSSYSLILPKKESEKVPTMPSHTQNRPNLVQNSQNSILETTQICISCESFIILQNAYLVSISNSSKLQNENVKQVVVVCGN